MSEVNAKIKEPQASMLREMVPLYGQTPGEVIGFIVTAWLHEHYGTVRENLDRTRIIREMLEREERDRGSG